jgi:ATP-dependent DNA helicase RecQ
VVLRGEVPLLLREAMPTRGKGARTRTGRGGAAKPPPRPLDAAALERFTALKAWRAEVARAHNLPAYVVFHDATLAEMADLRPDSLDSLAEISGVGARKLDAYGEQILGVLREG